MGIFKTSKKTEGMQINRDHRGVLQGPMRAPATGRSERDRRAQGAGDTQSNDGNTTER